jgi:hypothetical protein
MRFHSPLFGDRAEMIAANTRAEERTIHGFFATWIQTGRSDAQWPCWPRTLTYVNPQDDPRRARRREVLRTL